MAVGNLLNNALLLGNSSNSTRQSGGTTGVDLCTVHAHTRHYKKAEGTETHAVRGGQVGGLSRMTQRRLRGQVDDAPHR